ncbi:hypothetical protein [Bradyrhizobium sp. 2TAF24]|uniref:hypothetical protein n=1 Tax=Bradyrhizobium sp. 2TAF24 TaxID=3233011 RepID=UPI003F92364B
MDAQKMAVEAVVSLTGCDRKAVSDCIMKLYLSGIHDAKRLTFRALQMVSDR